MPGIPDGASAEVVVELLGTAFPLRLGEAVLQPVIDTTAATTQIAARWQFADFMSEA
jgi:hypothetical protein